MRTRTTSRLSVRTLVLSAAAVSGATFMAEQDAQAQAAFTVTQNSYNGSQWWGTITFKNVGTSATSSYRVEFDVPSGVNCTADAVPSGATLSPLSGARTTSNHCVFTWLNSSSLAPGASKTFNYSTNSQSFSAASNVEVTVPVVPGANKTLMHGTKCQPMGPTANVTYSFEAGLRHFEPSWWTFECGIDRKNPLSTGGLSELVIRFEHRGDRETGTTPLTAECLAVSVRPDQSLIRYVDKTITVQPPPLFGGDHRSIGVLDWGSSMNGSSAYGMIGISCRIQPGLWLQSVYYSEP